MNINKISELLEELIVEISESKFKLPVLDRYRKTPFKKYVYRDWEVKDNYLILFAGIPEEDYYKWEEEGIETKVFKDMVDEVRDWVDYIEIPSEYVYPPGEDPGVAMPIGKAYYEKGTGEISEIYLDKIVDGIAILKIEIKLTKFVEY